MLRVNYVSIKPGLSKLAEVGRTVGTEKQPTGHAESRITNVDVALLLPSDGCTAVRKLPGLFGP